MRHTTDLSCDNLLSTLERQLIDTPVSKVKELPCTPNVWDMLAGMAAASQISNPGAVIYAPDDNGDHYNNTYMPSDADMPFHEDESLASMKLRSEQLARDRIDDVKAICASGELEGCSYSPGDLVMHSTMGICSILREGYGQYNQELRVATATDDPTMWSDGRWVARSSVAPLFEGDLIVVTQPIPLIGDRQLSVGAVGAVKAVHHECVLVKFWNIAVDIHRDKWGCPRTPGSAPQLW
eukprot:UN0479